MPWRHRLWNVFRPRRLERDLERELRFHIVEKAEELQKDGMSGEQAANAARRQFGEFTRQIDRTREMDIDWTLESFARNLKYSLRVLAKAPAFTAAVILILALGIGANSAVFSAIYAVLLRPLPYPNDGQLVTLAQSRPKSPEPFVAPVRLEDWNRLNSAFQAISGWYIENVSELSGEFPEKLTRAWVAPRFLPVLGVAPELGRDFSRAEVRFGGPNAALISDRLWHLRFGGDAGALGKTLRIGKSAVTIIGVMPPSFQYPRREVDLWSLSAPDAPYAQSRDDTWFSGIGRLKPGVTLREARANLAAVQASLGRQFPKTDGAISPVIEPLKEVTVGGASKTLWLLFGSVTLLLLIACTNIAALLLSRASGREHEISVRFSLGESRASVAAQLLTEVLLLSLAGAALGLFVAVAVSRVFRAVAKDLPRVVDIAVDWRIFLYSLVCAVAVTLLCGTFPAIRGTRRNPALALARTGRRQVSGRSPLRFLLVGMEIALAVTLLAGAGLLLRSFEDLARVSPGFDPGHVLTFHVSNSWYETSDPKTARQRTDRILAGLRSLPGIESVSTSMSLPGVPGQYELEMKTTEGRAESEPKIFAESRWITPGYFATTHIPLVAGELCREDPGMTMVMVSRSFAWLYLNGPAAIGRHLYVASEPRIPAAIITGIVGDARETGLDRAPPPTAYWCNGAMQPGTFFLVRTRGEPESMSGTIRQKMRDLEPQRSVFDIAPLTDRISDSYQENRLRTILLASFALAAIALATIGLYGTLSYLVSARRREVALRMALGASRMQVIRQFVKQGLRVAVPGCIAGLALAGALGTMAEGMLYGVSATDPATLGGVLAGVLILALLASLLPAIRAARVEPMQALREE